MYLGLIAQKFNLLGDSTLIILNPITLKHPKLHKTNNSSPKRIEDTPVKQNKPNQLTEKLM